MEVMKGGTCVKDVCEIFPHMTLTSNLCAAIGIIVGVYVLVSAFQVYTYHTSQHNAASDRQGTVHMILEGVGIYARTAGIMYHWIATQHRKPLNLSNTTVLITGGNRGLGRGIAAHLAAFDAHLILPCRKCPADFDQQVLDDAKEYRKYYGTQATPNLTKVHVQTYENLDLANMDAIDDLVRKLKTEGVFVDLLIANAGLIDPYAARTKHGFETTFGVNFVGNVYLTYSLIQAGVLKPSARIVSVSTEDHRIGPSLKELMQETGQPFGYPASGGGIHDTLIRYSYSKLAQMTWYMALARKFPQLRVVDVCPGPVGSDISLSAPWPLDVIVTKILAIVFPSIQRASVPLVQLAVAPELAHETGTHFHMNEKKPARADVRDLEIQDEVWTWTLGLFKQRGVRRGE
jgi:NAD(P)-dependent dehydrogenase (short-subunit alcohol dehydrogenase family)